MGLADWRKLVMGGRGGGLMGLPGLPLAIDFGASSLKLLQLTHGAGGAEDDSPALVAAACLPTPDELVSDPAGRLAFQLEALPRLVKSGGFRTRRAICSIPAGRTLCRHLQLQTEPGAPLAALVRSAVPAQLKCDPSALVLRHFEVGQRSGKAEVICVAAAREFVEQLMRGMKESGLEPVGAHAEHTAMLRAFDSITRRIEDKDLTSLYLDIGAGLTKVVIAHGREIAFARTIELAGLHLDQAVASQLKLVPQMAHAHRLAMPDVARKAPAAAAAAPAPPAPAVVPEGLALLSAGLRRDGAATAVMEDRRQGQPAPGHRPAEPQRVPFSPPEADLSEPLEILTDEISMCMRYHESVFPDQKINRAVFVGGEARHLSLCQHIARTLRLPAQVADPMAGVARTGKEQTPGVDFSEPQPGWAATLGLCLSPTDL